MPQMMMPRPALAEEMSSFTALTQKLAEAALSHARTTPEILRNLLAAFPDHPRGHAAQALMMVLSGRVEVLPAAGEAAQKAALCASANHLSGFETDFAHAAMAATTGDWHGAIEHLEKALTGAPEETLAFKISHGLSFMLGDKRGLLASARLQLDRLAADHPHRGYIMGCLAFALEENGFYAEAEKVGMDGVRLVPADVWGLHAVSHVHEMQGRIGEGIAWLVGHETEARAANNFGFHLFWHLALFLIEQGDFPSVFALYDREIRAEKTDDFRDLANAASLLMRLQLMGIPVGNRWDELADKAEARLKASYLPFADLHALMALHGAGRHDILKRSCAKLATLHASSPQRGNADIANLSSTYIAGFEALGCGNTEEAFTRFRKYLLRDAGLGGSDAQRDIFTQIALDAGAKAGNSAALLPILSERMHKRGARNRFAQMHLSKLGSAISKQEHRQILRPAMTPIRAAMDTRHALAVLSV